MRTKIIRYTVRGSSIGKADFLICNDDEEKRQAHIVNKPHPHHIWDRNFYLQECCILYLEEFHARDLVTYIRTCKYKTLERKEI